MSIIWRQTWRMPAFSLMAKSPSVKWTREHLLMALSLYPQLRFGRLHSRNPHIKQVAEKMGRSAGSLAMKLTNFASLDPLLTQKGMAHTSAQDRALWAEYEKRRGDVRAEGETLLHALFGLREDQELDFLDPEGIRVVASELEIEAEETAEKSDAELRKLRRGYWFFRQAILNIYDVQCCITGIAMPRLLIASHIRPARKFPEERFNLNNGLCLSGLHSPAFAGGLITLDEQYRLMLSPRLKKQFSKAALKTNFEPYEGQPIRLPNVLAEPSKESLAYHREHVFQS